MDSTFETQLNALKADIDFYTESVKEVAIEMVKENFTQFPIFLASAHEVKIGELILSMRDFARDNDIYASTLEELVERKVIAEDKVAEFKTAYKNYKKFCCVLWLTPQTAQFVYIPYKKNSKEENPDD
ncbi:MAG: hypothetical protein V4538_08035 [Bacteroidota bacterium]